jgi:hypothetical protein
MLTLAKVYSGLSRAWPVEPPAGLTSRLERPLEMAAVGASPHIYAKSLLLLTGLSIAGLSLLILLPAPAPIHIPAATALLLTPLLPLIHLRLAMADRGRSCEDELPFLILLAAVLSPHGVYALPRALEIIATLGRSLLPRTFKEALLEAGERRFKTANPLASLSNVSRRHPSKLWRGFTEGYVSISLKGGDIPAYLTEQLGTSLDRLRERWQGLARKTADLVEVSGIVLALTPTMAAMTMFVYPADEAISTLHTLIIVLPVVTTLMIALFGLIQPARNNRTPKIPILLLTATTAPLTIWLSRSLGPASALLSASLIGLLASAPISERTLLKIREGEGQLCRLLRDLRDLLQIGFSPLEAFRRLDPRSYPALSPQLSQSHIRLEAGMPPSKALQISHPSWFVRVCFFTLAIACETGGGPSEIHILTSFAERFEEAKKAIARESAGASAIAIAIPFISAFGLTTLSSIAEQAASLLSGLRDIGSLNPRRVLAWANLASVESSILMGFVLSKTTFGTISSLLFPLILTASATLASLMFGLMGV